MRPEKVVHGKALIADPNYPSPQHIRQIARHFAANWNGEDDLFRRVVDASGEPYPKTLARDELKGVAVPSRRMGVLQVSD